MEKQIWKPGTVLYPVPAVMVSCGNMEQKNIITVAWTGTINTNPPMTYAAFLMRKEEMYDQLSLQRQYHRL
mgnify:CR=1 FL=1